MKAIFRKEISSYFNSMTGYVFTAFMIVVLGLYFTTMNVVQGNPYFANALKGSLFVFIIAIPVLTMKSMAEERRAKTDQAFLTSPNSVTSIILGKYFAMVCVFAIPAALSLVCPLIIRSLGSWHPRTDYAGIFVFFLTGCLYIAAGLYISALTESQITAAIGSIAVILLFYLWDSLLEFIPYTPTASLIGFLAVCLLIFAVIRSVTGRTLPAAAAAGCLAAVCAVLFVVKDSLFAGAIRKVLTVFSTTKAMDSVITASLLDLRSVILYVSFIFLFVFLTIQSVKKRQWM